MLAMLLIAGTMSAAQPAGTAPTPAVSNDAQALIEALSTIGAIIAKADRTVGTEAAALAEKSATDPAASDQNVEKKPRSAKNSAVLVTSGAAAGAALGGAMGKGSKGAIVGATVGGVIGLIYDRMTYKNPGTI